MSRYHLCAALLLLTLSCSAILPQSILPESPGTQALLHPIVSPPPASRLFSAVEPARQISAATPVASGFNIDRDESPDTRYKASTYVPIDSWVYPALDRLIALGYIQTGSLAIRPFTRLECARLIAEAHILSANENPPSDNSSVQSMLEDLDHEFAPETTIIDGGRNANATVERVYARYTGVAGTPLRDSFHFGQTIYNDFGRPYGKGSNLITGLSAHSEYGPFAVYVRGEFQRAASSPGYSPLAQQAIMAYDQSREGWNLAPGQSPPPVLNFNPAPVTRSRFVEAYATVNLYNWQISFGQQSLWWGPDRTTSLILSNNAAAMPMLRLARVKPVTLPFLLKYFGPIHFDAFAARQGGIHYVALTRTFNLYGTQNSPLTPPPVFLGITFSSEPTKNIEMTFAHTTVFAGYGRPLNLRTFFHTLSPYGNDQVREPGKRVTEFNFSYHVPFLRHQLLAYIGAMSWDNPFQGHFTERFALDPGIYFSQIPHFKKLDLRLEGVYTDLPGLPEQGYFYANAHYLQGYTNYGQIVGSWIGRQGRGGSGTSTYWFSARTKATVTFRRTVANPLMLQGGNLNDISAGFTCLLGRRIELSTVQQYERWRYPVITAGPKSNFSTTFQVQLLNRPRL